MSVSVSHEAFVFLCAALTGGCISFLYDLFRLLRQGAQTEGFFVHVQDLVFWLLACGMMFFVMLYVNNGSVRFYEFLGAALGALLYCLTLSKLVLRLLRFILRFFSVFFKKFLKILLTPLLFMYNIMYRCVNPVICALVRLARRLFRRLKEGMIRSRKLMKRK